MSYGTGNISRVGRVFIQGGAKLPNTSADFNAVTSGEVFLMKDNYVKLTAADTVATTRVLNIGIGLGIEPYTNEQITDLVDIPVKTIQGYAGQRYVAPVVQVQALGWTGVVGNLGNIPKIDNDSTYDITLTYSRSDIPEFGLLLRESFTYSTGRNATGDEIVAGFVAAINKSISQGGSKWVTAAPLINGTTNYGIQLTNKSFDFTVTATIKAYKEGCWDVGEGATQLVNPSHGHGTCVKMKALERAYAGYIMNAPLGQFSADGMDGLPFREHMITCPNCYDVLTIAYEPIPASGDIHHRIHRPHVLYIVGLTTELQAVADLLNPLMESLNFLPVTL
jgi:hypothetical protein